MTLNLLDLPQELLDIILEPFLIFPHSLIVPCIHKTAVSYVLCNKCGSHSVFLNSGLKKDPAKIPTGLFRVNRRIGASASRIFYSNNTFNFSDDHDWFNIGDWLKLIGPSNRGSLNKIEITVRRPRHCYQKADGTRSWKSMHKAYPRLQDLEWQDASCGEGPVENLSPAMKTVFDLLADVTRPPCRRPLSIQLVMTESCLPGVRLYTNDRTHYFSYSTLDIPNLLERYRSHCSASRSVDILWKATLPMIAFAEKRELIEEHWTIFDAREMRAHWQSERMDEPVWRELVCLDIRRKGIPDILIASGPLEGDTFDAGSQALFRNTEGEVYETVRNLFFSIWQ